MNWTTVKGVDFWLVSSMDDVCILKDSDDKAVEWAVKKVEKDGNVARVTDFENGYYFVGIDGGNDIFYIQPIRLDEEVESD